MKKVLIAGFCFIFFFTSVLLGQSTSVIRLSNKYGEYVAGATVMVKFIKDSTRSWAGVTDSLGKVQFNLQSGRYRVEAEAISYIKINKVILMNGGDDIKLVIEQDTTTMKGIVITARKPLMRQEDDKTIVDPEPVALSSTHAFEVMEKIPGLYVDQDGNVYLNSTSPSAVWINGREQKMSAADIATLLKSLPPTAIDRIELIRTPSARYDASGVGGIVNVILKKNVRIGLTGSINSGFNQGKYGNRFGGFNLNKSESGHSAYLNVNFNHRNGFDQINTARLLGMDSSLQQFSRTLNPGSGLYLGAGMNRELNDHFSFGLDGRVSLNYNKGHNENPTKIFQPSTEQLFLSTLSITDTRTRSINANIAFNTKYKIDTIGSEWNQDLSYSFDPGRNRQNLENDFLFPRIIVQNLEGQTESQSHFISYQGNLIKKFPKKLTLESGIKSNNLWFGNDTKYSFVKNGISTPDQRRTNSYDYREHIHAAYLQGSKTMGPVVIKAGVRLENTNMIGQQQIPTDTSFKIHRTDAFPYVYISRALVKIAGYELRGYLVYRRSITRPSYSLLNPAIRVLDPFLYETGNPSLRPQFTKNYEANISADERPLFAVGVNETQDIFSQVFYQADSSRSQAYRTYDNVGKNRELYFRGIAAIPPGKKYFFVVGTQYNLNNYEGKYEGLPLVFKRGTWSIFTFHNLKLTKTTQFSLQGFVRFKGQLQFYELSTFGALNANISQQFLKRKLTVTVNANDILYTNRNNFLLSQGSVRANGERYNDSRRFGVNLRYNFGIKRKEKQEGIIDQIGNVQQ